MSGPASGRRAHLLTVAVEDYFHSRDLSGAVVLKHWDRLDSRLDRNVDEVLEFLGRFGASATFFVFGCTAERHPEIVRRIARAGHEVASRGYRPRWERRLLPDEFRDDVRRAGEALEAAGANRIVGFRAPAWIRDRDVWILDVLAEEGYLYDSSINPVLRRFASDPRRFAAHQHRHPSSGATLWEFPVSTVGLLGLRVAISGGNYIRQLPHTLLRRAVDWWDRNVDEPLVFYFMPWEFDREQPLIGSISPLSRVRHYRNLAKTRWVLHEYLSRFRLQAIGDHLGLERAAPRKAPAAPVEVASARTTAAVGEAVPVTLVVPVFDERPNLGYLLRAVEGLRRELAGRYRLHLTIVDDGSGDGTWEEIQARFAGVADFTALRHPANRGVAAAVLTGIRNAPTEIVCSIDCDCSYDPAILADMLPLADKADLVTASPYHPQGRAVNVPRWRLLLSRSLSRVYSAILGEQIHTFTSCCRVYRKSVVTGLQLHYEDFLGIAEMLVRARLAGARIVEHPATLEARLLGTSKMRTPRTVRRHLSLIYELVFRRREGSEVPRRSSVRG